jgi:predicted nucleic acid-binding protein
VRFALIDTSIYVDHWERGEHEELLAQVRSSFVVRHSAVVLCELRQGARTVQARRLVEALRRTGTEWWFPSATDWWKCGALVQRLGDAHDWDRNKRRGFQNDTLIALTARRHGATIVTSNQGDFALLASALAVHVLAPPSRLR